MAELGWIGLLLLPGALHQGLDRSVPPWDPARVGRNAAELWWALGEDPRGWLSRMLDQQGAWPPLPAWVGQLFVPFGEGGLAAASLLATALSLWAVGVAGRALHPAGGRPAQVLVAGAPITLGLAGRMFAEPFQAAVVALLAALALGGAGWGRRDRAAALAGLLALGLLCKATLPLFVVGPVVGVLGGLRAGPAGGGRWTVPLAGLAVLGALAWYLRHGGEALAHLQQGAALVDGLNQGGLAFWVGALPQSLLGPTVIGALAVFERRPATWTEGERWAVGGALMGLLLVVGPLIAFDNVEPRFLGPLAPLLAVGAVAAVGGRRWGMRLLWAGGLLQFLHGGAVVVGLVEGGPGQLHWMEAPDRGGEERRVAAALVAASCPPGATGVVEVLVELPALNANSLALIGAFAALPARCSFVPAGAAAPGSRRAFVVAEASTLPESTDGAVLSSRPGAVAREAAARAAGMGVVAGPFGARPAVWVLGP